MKRIILVALTLMLAACGGDDGKPEAVRPLSGSHLIADGAADTKQAVNALGKTPENPLGAGDILGVRMDADKETLRVRIAIGQFPLDRLPPDEKMGPAYFLQLWPSPKAKGAPMYFIAIVRDGTPKRTGDRAEGWRLSVCKGQDACDMPASGAELAIVGKEVRADVPLTLLDGIGNPFSWAALSYWNDTLDPLKAWSDWVPDNARPTGGPTSYSDPDTRAVFPPPQAKKK